MPHTTNQNLDSQRSIQKAISELEEQKPIIILDDIGKQIIGYLVAWANCIDQHTVCTLVNHGRSVVCCAMPEERVAELGLPLMSPRCDLASIEGTVSVEARHGVSTGISAEDRAQTLRILASTHNAHNDLVMPGHIFPVRAKQGGVLVRSTIAEASTDILTLGRLVPVAAFCHCLNENGELPSESELHKLASTLGLHLVRISEIIQHQLSIKPIVEQISTVNFPTKYAGTFKAICFRSLNDNVEHLALVKGEVSQENCLQFGQNKDKEQIAPKENIMENIDPIPVRVQAECRLDDLLGIDSPNQRALMTGALRAINKAGKGVFVYIRHPKKGLLQEHVERIAHKQTKSKVEQIREYGIGAQILSALGVKKVSLLTRTGKTQISGLNAFKIEIDGFMEFEPHSDTCNSNE